MPASPWRPRQTRDVYVPFTQIPYADFPESFGEVGVIEFRLKVTSQVCRRRHGEVGIVEFGLNNADNETRRVREEYEKRLKVMTDELRELVSTSKQHIMTVRNQQTDQKQLNALLQQLAEMNKLKVSPTSFEQIVSL